MVAKEQRTAGFKLQTFPKCDIKEIQATKLDSTRKQTAHQQTVKHALIYIYIWIQVLS